MIFKNSKLLLIILSLVSVILLATLALGVYSIRAKNQGISELLNLADRATEMEALARSIRSVQNETKEDLAAFDNFVISGDKLVTLIESIEEAGQTLGLEIKIVSVSKVEDKKATGPEIVRIAIETQGSWAPTLSFLRAIENLPHRLMIDESSVFKEEVGWRSRVILSLYSFD